MGMTRYLMRRLGLILITLWVISFAIFVIIEILPGDVAKMMLKQNLQDGKLILILQKLIRLLLIILQENSQGSMRDSLSKNIGMVIMLDQLVIMRQV